MDIQKANEASLKNSLPSPDQVYKKRAGQTIFLTFILEKTFFSHKYIINKDYLMIHILF